MTGHLHVWTRFQTIVFALGSRCCSAVYYSSVTYQRRVWTSRFTHVTSTEEEQRILCLRDGLDEYVVRSGEDAGLLVRLLSK